MWTFIDDRPRTDFVRCEYALRFSDCDIILRIQRSLKSLILGESYIRAKQIGSFVIKLIRNCKRNPDKKHNSIILLVLQNLLAHPNKHCLHVPSLLLHGSSLMQCPSHWCAQFSPKVLLLQTVDKKIIQRMFVCNAIPATKEFLFNNIFFVKKEI